MGSNSRKNTRVRKARASKKTERPDISGVATSNACKAITIVRKPAVRPFAVVEAEMKAAHDPYHKLLSEFVAHPEFQRQSVENEKANEAKKRREQKVAHVAHIRRQAAFPVAENPLTDRDLTETLHNIKSFADYVSLLELPEALMGDTSDRVQGKYLLGRVLVSALKAACEQEEFERKETRAKHEAALAKAGAK